MVLQGVEFDGAYALSISEALGCLQEARATGGRGPAGSWAEFVDDNFNPVIPS